MKEIDDYNEEYFYQMEDDWEEYEDLLPEEYEQALQQDMDFSYDVFVYEQTLSGLRKAAKDLSYKDLANAAQEANKKLEKFIELYTEYYS